MARQLTGVSIPGGADAFAAGGTLLTGAARLQFADALHYVFMAGTVLASLSFAATFFLPPVDFSPGMARVAGEIEL
jgi:hypothetical protein